MLIHTCTLLLFGLFIFLEDVKSFLTEYKKKYCSRQRIGTAIMRTGKWGRRKATYCTSLWEDFCTSSFKLGECKLKGKAEAHMFGRKHFPRAREGYADSEFPREKEESDYKLQCRFDVWVFGLTFIFSILLVPQSDLCKPRRFLNRGQTCIHKNRTPFVKILNITRFKGVLWFRGTQILWLNFLWCFIKSALTPCNLF